MEQKLKTSDNNNSAKIQSHINSLQYNSDKAKKENDKAKFEEMKRKYNQAPETSTNIFTKTKSKILNEVGDWIIPKDGSVGQYFIKVVCSLKK